MKKLLVLFFVFVSTSLMAEPDWFNKTPKDSGNYYFAGVGSGATEKLAKEMALADVFSQIVYMVNASVTSNSTFEQYSEENGDSARKVSSVYKKVRAKGEAVIQEFEEVEKVQEKSKDKDGKAVNTLYILIKVPKKEIDNARKAAEAEKAKKKANPFGVFAVAVFPDKHVEEIPTIKNEVETMYRNMGYNIKDVDIEFNPEALKSPSKLAKYIKDNGGDLKKAVICIITPTNVRKEKQQGFTVTSYLGDMVIREIDLTTGEILSNSKFSGKGVSMRKGEDAAEDAFRKLINALTNELLGQGDSEGGKKGGKDDYI